MNVLRWIKDSFVSILLGSVGILAVIATALFGRLKAKAKEAKQAVETINQNRKQVKAVVDQARKHKEKENEIQSDAYNPITDFHQRNK